MAPIRPPHLHELRASQPKFGGRVSPPPGLLEQGLRNLEANPLKEIIVKDIVGFNLPKMLNVRTWREFWDVTTLELSNTSVTLLGSLLIPPLTRNLVGKIADIPAPILKKAVQDLSPQELAQWSLPRIKLGRLGSAFGFLFPFGAAFWAAPFFRNYSTLVKTNGKSFESLIGLDKEGVVKAERTPEEEKRHQLKTGFQTLGVGLALGLASALSFGLAARHFKGPKLGQTTEKLFNAYNLIGKDSNQINWWPTLVFWSMGAYGGWLHAARSANEFKEQALKAANSILWFSLLSKYLVKPLFQFKVDDTLQNLTEVTKAGLKLTYENIDKLSEFKPLQPVFTAKPALLKESQQALTQLLNKQASVDLGISILMLSLTPQLLNRYLTKRRFEKQYGQPVVETPAQGVGLRPNPNFRAFSATVNP